MKKQRLLKRIMALILACVLLLSVSGRADVMVKWGVPGGDTGIMTGTGTVYGQNQYPGSYNPATLVNPADGVSDYDVDAAGQTREFTGVFSPTNATPVFVNDSDEGDYMQLVNDFGAGSGTLEQMTVWKSSDFLSTGGNLHSYTIEVEATNTYSSHSLKFLLETSAGWYVTDQNYSATTSLTEVFPTWRSLRTGDFTFTGFDRFGRTAGSSQPNLSDILSVGFYSITTGSGVQGFNVRYFEVTDDKNYVAPSRPAGYPAFSWDYVPKYMHTVVNTGLTDQQCQWLAERFDVITFALGVWDYQLPGSVEYEIGEDAAMIHSYNPNAKVLAYWAGDYLKGQYVDINATIPSGCLLDERDGRTPFDTTNANLRAWWSDVAADLVTTYNCDGIYVDGGTAYRPGSTIANLWPEIADELYLGSLQMHADAITKMGSGKLYVFNPIGGNANGTEPIGWRFFPTSDGAMVEQFDRDGDNTTPSYMAELVADMEIMRDANRNGKIILFKAWPGFDWGDPIVTENPYEVTLDAARDYITFPLACHLISAEVDNYFGYTWGWNEYYGHYEWYPEYDKPLGAPLSEAIRVGLEFWREFEHASVYLNMVTKTAIIDWDTPTDVLSLNPANNETDAPSNTSLQIFFDEKIQKGSGNIVIKESSGSSVMAIINAASGDVAINANRATITLPFFLAPQTQYHVDVDSSAFTDTSGNLSFAGITGSTDWQFTASAVTDPNIQWGATGGDTEILTEGTNTAGQNPFPAVYNPATLVNPADGTNGYDVDAVGRSNEFSGAYSNTNTTAVFVNNEAGDYMQLVYTGDFTAAPFETMVVWEYSQAPQLESFTVEYREKSTTNVPTVSFVVETSAGWYVTDQTDTMDGTTYKSFALNAASATFSGFNKFGVTAGSGQPNLSDIKSVGVLSSTTNTVVGWTGTFIRYVKFAFDSGTGNNAPAFTDDPMSRSNATEGSAYIDTIAGSATDADSDPLTYSKISGPSWLAVYSDGTIGGIPAESDIGSNSFGVRVFDNKGGTATATLNISVLGSVDIVKWGEAGGDLLILTEGTNTVGQNNFPAVYNPATLVNPADGTNGYDIDAVGRTNEFSGAYSDTNTTAVFVNNAAGDYMQLVYYGDFSAAPFETMVVWDSSKFLPGGDELKELTVEFKERNTFNEPTVSFVVETSAGWYVTDQTDTMDGSTYKSFILNAATATFSGFNKFGVTAGSGQPNLSDIQSVGVLSSTTGTVLGWTGTFIRHIRVLASSSGTPDTDPPTPNPATFSSAPSADSSSAISMTATTGSDATGPVEYYFDETSGNPGATDSGWQTSASYTDTGLTASTQYTYTVQMRDALANTGTASAPANATTDPAPDTDPPTPNPATFAVAPAADSSSAISMTATTGSDASGPVEYYFDETSGNPGGSDSGWQTSTSYTDTGLDPDTTYTYTVQMRDSAPTPNVGTASAPANATTDPLPPALPWTEGFESGSFTEGGWTITGSAAVSTQAAYTGTYGAKIPGTSSSIETAIDTTGFTNIHVKYRRETVALDAGEYLLVEWYDGSSWNPLETIQIALFSDGLQDKTCGAGADNNASFKIRFSISCNKTNEVSYVDDIEVTGTSGTPDTDPPTPNPATWASAPAAISDTAISMTATTGSDASGPVEYYFDETSGNPGGTDSGWQTSPSYTDTGLTASTQYTYTVQMRDALANTGTASAPANATTDDPLPPDTDPPTPNPATWASAPSADSSSAISMTATTGSDATGPVEYYFDETSGNPGGTDSGWQTSPSYTDTGLNASTQYTYTVQMRDAVTPTPNVGTASSPANATTDAGCTPTDMHIEAVVCSEVSCGPAKYNGRATVTIYDDCGNPVVNALVDGTFGGDFSETIYDVATDANGQAVLTTTACVKGPSWTFTVDAVTHGTLPHDSNDDLATGCSD
ncbi:MAG: putative glycoside hydrolase [Phycisphaerae bacterium]|nr:putative glycoside hydrolase [Phycisphaerae bacterium]